MNAIAVRQAALSGIDALTALLDRYRQFYGRESDLDAVAPLARKQGVGGKLIAAAVGFAKAVGAVRLALSTAVTNSTAQAL